MALDSNAAKGIRGHFYLPRPSEGAREPFALDVQLDLPGSGVTGVFGPSGSGKTTLLRCIAGLQACDNGSLTVNGQHWQIAGDRRNSLAVHQRPLGFVFQQPSLFPHLSAAGNLAFARKRAAQDVSEAEFADIIELMGIGHLLTQRPDALSGGEQQRVAIARALLINPRLLLMDEPLASLDPMRKREILPYLEKLHRALDIPILYVSHSVEEIARLADYLLLMDEGKIVSEGNAASLMSREDFPVPQGDDLGVLVEAEIAQRDVQWKLVRGTFDGGDLWLRDGGETVGETIRIRILARDISLTLTEDRRSSILNRLPVVVQEISPDRDPAMVLVRLVPQSVSEGNASSTATRLIARITRRSLHQLSIVAGSKLWAQIKSVAIVR
ncbi:molybdenum ABC transporter ATP-binding protein [Microbulbifer hydrolyticus]|uniref:Molybdate transport system ATP-binding protein n=1 Tax=Microbulbifer hydrolyticus TaxID=48074 RepID=A0A6P1TBB8_9GAMM|nr:molybdenum ABC transporter ATP-binding protein [Microbulbifer hydrolyticus]MBB5210435.1 molybdate transport system ATP-binding protein [Microbulbifer hydrolyticus]QHQ39081.1 molybdenum ABC transporter ATP-binding protein [Microbulbifer hydrolyticus]